MAKVGTRGLSRQAGVSGGLRVDGLRDGGSSVSRQRWCSHTLSVVIIQVAGKLRRTMVLANPPSNESEAAAESSRRQTAGGYITPDQFGAWLTIGLVLRLPVVKGAACQERHL